jgi:hypothetical protein
LLVSTMAHEVRTLCGAAVLPEKNLSRMPSLEVNEDFQVISVHPESGKNIDYEPENWSVRCRGDS